MLNEKQNMITHFPYLLQRETKTRRFNLKLRTDANRY